MLAMCQIFLIAFMKLSSKLLACGSSSVTYNSGFRPCPFNVRPVFMIVTAIEERAFTFSLCLGSHVWKNILSRCRMTACSSTGYYSH